MILVTGAAGFIGINYLKMLSKTKGLHNVVVVDSLTYAANVNEIRSLPVALEVVDIANYNALREVFDKYNIGSIVNFAAESHVDNSIVDCTPFVHSNIIGTVNLLQLARQYEVSRFLQISTDEVFGQALEGPFVETSAINPRNPYSASKASAEHFVNAFRETYGVPTLIVNCSNNYGPWQYHEKLIPLTINRLLDGKNVPLYGNGQQVRDWIYVEDAVEAISAVYDRGIVGERYCIGGDCPITNLDLVRYVLRKMYLPESRIEFVKDRLGHDVKYHTDCTKIKQELDWTPRWSLGDGIKETIRWVETSRQQAGLV